MYIQITTRCNMLCKHCCFSCTKKGIDMTMETFIAVCKLAKKMGDYIVLGGGEPTIHPNFFEMLGISIVYSEENLPLVITNGKISNIAYELYWLTKNNKIYCNLSQDSFHEPIDKKIVSLFTNAKLIRNVDQNIIPVGRGKKISTSKNKKQCSCNELFIDPTGYIYSCGCKKICYGHITESNIYDIVFKNYKMNESCPKENKYRYLYAA